MNVADVLRDVLSRVALASDAILDGDREFADSLLADLERDLRRELERLQEDES